MKLYVSSYKTMMVTLLVLALAPVSSYSLPSASAPTLNVSEGAQSFREWKNSRIQSARQKVKSLKDKLGDDPNLVKSTALEAGLNQELEREILNLSLTQDLTVSDYFVGYLNKQRSVETAIKDVSVKLSPEEVAELMSAYAHQFLQNRPSALKASSRADFAR